MDRLIQIEDGKVYEARLPEGEYLGCNPIPEHLQLYDGPWPEGVLQYKWDEVTGTVVADEEAEKEDKYLREKSQIKEDYIKEVNAPVTVGVPEGRFIFNGGFDSATLINGEVQFAQMSKSDQAIITDIDNEEIVLSLSSAQLVAFEVARVAREAFFKKQRRKRKANGQDNSSNIKRTRTV